MSKVGRVEGEVMVWYGIGKGQSFKVQGVGWDEVSLRVWSGGSGCEAYRLGSHAATLRREVDALARALSHVPIVGVQC